MTLLDLLLFLLIGTAMAQPVRVVDGDGIELHGVHYRLHGVDAPEKAQTCHGWPAGLIATNTLSGLILGRDVACEWTGDVSWGRPVAVCRVEGHDIGRILVRSGLAWNYDRFSDEYEQDEALARSEGLGVHAHQCQEPWRWRKERR